MQCHMNMMCLSLSPQLKSPKLRTKKIQPPLGYCCPKVDGKCRDCDERCAVVDKMSFNKTGQL